MINEVNSMIENLSKDELYAEVHNYLSNKGIGSNYGTEDVIDATMEVIKSIGDINLNKCTTTKFTHINWQYFADPNYVNTAIDSKDPDWEGLESSDQIISITYVSNHGCYVIFWKVR